MNRVVLVGNLTQTPELRSSVNGKAVAHFTVACQRNYKDADGNYPTDFIDCTAWGGTAEFVCKYFTKGQRIALEGSMQTYVKEDRGENRKHTRVHVDNVDFASNRYGRAGRDDEVPPPTDADDYGVTDYEGELPWDVA